MTQEPKDQRLSQISTAWSDVFQAHHGAANQIREAQERLILRYSRAVHSYLLGAVHDEDVADDLYQEFVLRLVSGRFKAAAPERGRFRNYLKTCLYHLIVDYQRSRKYCACPMRGDEPAAAQPPLSDAERQFQAMWRGELIDRTWKALEQFERESGQPAYTLLRYKTEHLDLRASELAEQLTAQLGKPLSATWVDKHLCRARKKFTDLLVEEVAQTLGCASVELLELELAELDLLEWCRAALERRRDTLERQRTQAS